MNLTAMALRQRSNIVHAIKSEFSPSLKYCFPLPSVPMQLLLEDQNENSYFEFTHFMENLNNPRWLEG